MRMAVLNMGNLSMQSGSNIKEPLSEFEELIQFNPNNLQGQFYLGRKLFLKQSKNKQKLSLRK